MKGRTMMKDQYTNRAMSPRRIAESKSGLFDSKVFDGPAGTSVIALVPWPRRTDHGDQCNDRTVRGASACFRSIVRSAPSLRLTHSEGRLRRLDMAQRKLKHVRRTALIVATPAAAPMV